MVRKKSALLCQDQLVFGFGRPLPLNFNDSQCLFSELPRQLPLMEFLPLRATCKLYSKTEAFQKLLAVKWPKQALAAARQKHLSAEELLTFPKVRSSVMGGKTRSHFYGFCCPEDRRKLDRFCGTIDMPSTMCKSVFINKVDDSYETMHEARFYRARSERGWGSFQSFVWGLGNWAALALFWKGNVFFPCFSSNSPTQISPKLGTWTPSCQAFCEGQSFKSRQCWTLLLWRECAAQACGHRLLHPIHLWRRRIGNLKWCCWRKPHTQTVPQRCKHGHNCKISQDDISYSAAISGCEKGGQWQLALTFSYEGPSGCPKQSWVQMSSATVQPSVHAKKAVSGSWRWPCSWKCKRHRLARMTSATEQSSGCVYYEKGVNGSKRICCMTGCDTANRAERIAIFFDKIRSEIPHAPWKDEEYHV